MYALWNVVLILPWILIMFLSNFCCFVTSPETGEENCYRGDARLEYDTICSNQPVKLEYCSKGQRLEEACTEKCVTCDDGTYQDEFTNCSTCLNCITAADCPLCQVQPVIIKNCSVNSNAVCGCPTQPACPTCASCPSATPCPSVTPCPVLTECPACECPTDTPEALTNCTSCHQYWIPLIVVAVLLAGVILWQCILRLKSTQHKGLCLVQAEAGEGGDEEDGVEMKKTRVGGDGLSTCENEKSTECSPLTGERASSVRPLPSTNAKNRVHEEQEKALDHLEGELVRVKEKSEEQEKTLREELKNAEGEVEELQGEKTALTDELEQSKHSLHINITKVTTLTEELAQARAEFASEKGTLSEQLKLTKENLDASRTESTKEIQRLTEQLKETDQSLDLSRTESTKEIQRLTEQLKESNQSFDLSRTESTKEIQRLTEQLKETNQSLDLSRTESTGKIATLTDEITRIKTESTKDIETLKEELEQTQTKSAKEIETLTEELEQTKQSLDLSRTKSTIEIETLTAKLQETKQKLDTRIKELETANRDLEVTKQVLQETKQDRDISRTELKQCQLDFAKAMAEVQKESGIVSSQTLPRVSSSGKQQGKSNEDLMHGTSQESSQTVPHASSSQRQQVKSNKDPMLKTFLYLSQNLGEEWQKVGRHLWLVNATLSHIKQDIHQSEEAIYKMLIAWKQENGSSATYEILSDALREAGRTDLAEKVQHRMEFV